MAYVSRIREPHESFPQPSKGNLRVWRYVDLVRLISVLSTNELPFARVDLFRDDFEGSVTRAVYEAVAKNRRNAAMFARFRPEMKRDVYASCWHANDSESEAMWRLYCPSGEGVAFQTTYRKLDESLPANVFLGKVTYINYDTAEIGRMGMTAALNALSPIMHKRPAFAFEQEVRAVIWRPSYFVAQGMSPEEFPAGQPPVMTVPWKVDEVVDAMFLSPYSSEWYRDIVAKVVQTFAPKLIERLQWSRMKATPLY